MEPAADIFLYSPDNESSPCFSYTSKSDITAVELARLLGFVALRVRGSIRLLIHEKCSPGHFILIPLAGGPLSLNAGNNNTAPPASQNRMLLSQSSPFNGILMAQKNSPAIPPAVATPLTRNSKVPSSSSSSLSSSSSSSSESESAQSDVNKPTKNNTTPRVSKVSPSLTVSPRKKEHIKTKASADANNDDKDDGDGNNADAKDDGNIDHLEKKKYELIRYLNPATWETAVTTTNSKFDQEVREIIEVIFISLFKSFFLVFDAHTSLQNLKNDDSRIPRKLAQALQSLLQDGQVLEEVCTCVSSSLVIYLFNIFPLKKVWDLVASFRNLEEYSRFLHDNNDDKASVDGQSIPHVHMFSNDFSRNLRKAGSRYQIYCTDQVCLLLFLKEVLFLALSFLLSQEVPLRSKHRLLFICPLKDENYSIITVDMKQKNWLFWYPNITPVTTNNDATGTISPEITRICENEKRVSN